MTDPARLISPRAYAHPSDLQVRFALLVICSEATCKSLILRLGNNPRWLAVFVGTEATGPPQFRTLPVLSGLTAITAPTIPFRYVLSICPCILTQI
jgi:hypothetical protein